MGSSNKSEFLGLNIWAGTDIPKRTDFNYDNALIDGALKEHCEDMQQHVTQKEREEWSKPYYMNVYFGNSAATRTIVTGCPFEPTLGIVFANVTAPAVTNFSNSMNNNYFAVVSKRANTLGASLSGRNLAVKQSSTAAASNEYACFNATGYTYCYILFR